MRDLQSNDGTILSELCFFLFMSNGRLSGGARGYKQPWDITTWSCYNYTVPIEDE